MNPIGTVWRGIVLDCQWQQQADPWSAYPARAGTSAGRDVLQYGRNGHQLLARSPVERESVPNRVAFGEPKSIRRNLPSAQVNGNARPGNWPGVSVSRCCQRVTAFPPPALALSGSRARFWGPKATMTVALVARKSGRELSDSLLNRPSRVNSRVAFGTYRHFELAPGN